MISLLLNIHVLKILDYDYNFYQIHRFMFYQLLILDMVPSFRTRNTSGYTRTLQFRRVRRQMNVPRTVVERLVAGLSINKPRPPEV